MSPSVKYVLLLSTPLHRSPQLSTPLSTRSPLSTALYRSPPLSTPLSNAPNRSPLLSTNSSSLSTFSYRHVLFLFGNVYGRVEVARANHSRIDSMDVLVKATNQPGAIVVMLSGDGPNLIRSNVVISNNNVRTEGTIGQGAAVGIMLYRGAVGVDVIGNRISHFSLASLQLGWGQSNVGDAMLALVTKNDIIHGFGQLGDSAGIYLDTHWVNPGNILRCNYVQRGGHCLYLDWVSSGTVVDGLVCEQTADGMKLNTGKK
ncbi:unnamed protein product [Closterium sp. Naga37s-1]|nr:unnamed protein product [Closterium sp. Naga37s-1]